MRFKGPVMFPVADRKFRGTVMRKRLRIGLALGGGGARGLAHIGVLKVLEREGIPVDLIVGTSMGALVGAAYALAPEARALERKVTDFLANGRSGGACLKRLGKLHPFNPEKIDFLHRILRIAQKHVFLSLNILKKALVSEEDMHALLSVFLPDIKVEDTVIPFAASTVDLVTGKEVILMQGPLVAAVMASCAVPGFLPPVAREGMVLVDGAVLDPVPVNAAKAAGAEMVIGVDVGLCLCESPPIEDGIDVINRAMEVMGYSLNCRSRERADIIIEPDVKRIPWTGFTHHEDLIREGERAAEERIDAIRRKLEHRSWKEIFPLHSIVNSWRRGVPAHAK
jgi:NTE family protein